MKKEYRLSIHRFIDLTAQEGDLLTGFFSQQRAVEGIKGHQQIQKKRPDGYISEEKISKTYQQGDFTLHLEGRIDGFYWDKDELHIEEIKTLTAGIPSSWDEAPALHKAQLICYGALFQNESPEVQLHLCYYQMDQKIEINLQKIMDRKEIDSRFQVYLNRFFTDCERRMKWFAHRDQSAKELHFPFGDYRRGQRELSVETYRALRDNKILIAQAPTGIGKTMGTLFSGIKSLGEGNSQRILYLTAKTTGRAMAEEALALLVSKGLSIHSLTLTAKNKICLSPESPRCHGDDCEYAKDFFDKLREVQRPERAVLRREDMEKIGHQWKICPFELSMEWALDSDIVIGDFNHLFDPIVSLKRFFRTEEKIGVLIDESHNLLERGRKMFSAEILKSQFLSLNRIIKDSNSDLSKKLKGINRKLLEWKKTIPKGEEQILENFPDDLKKRWLKLQQNMERVLSRPDNREGRQELSQLYFSVRFFLNILDLMDKQHVILASSSKSDLKIELYCLDPSVYLLESIKKCSGTVLFSATLNPPEYYGKVLLNDSEYEKISVESPFPLENCLILNRKDISTRYKERQKYMNKLLSSIEVLWQEHRGHQMVFFPSYAYLEEAKEAWEGKFSIPLACQERDMEESYRESFIENFDTKDPKLVFAVLGGIFSEGLDLVGEKLSAVTLVSVGFPPPDRKRELLMEYYSEHDMDGFNFAYRYPGWNKILQAAGRLIRSEKDRGVLLLIDDRYSQWGYKKIFPSHWKKVQHIQSDVEQKKYIVEFNEGK